MSRRLGRKECEGRDTSSRCSRHVSTQYDVFTILVACMSIHQPPGPHVVNKKALPLRRSYETSVIKQSGFHYFVTFDPPGFHHHISVVPQSDISSNMAETHSTYRAVLGTWDYLVLAAMLAVSASIGIYYRFSGNEYHIFLTQNL